MHSMDHTQHGGRSLLWGAWHALRLCEGRDALRSRFTTPIAPLWACHPARFTDLARRRGHVGLMPFLAGFFKSPYAVEKQGFIRQFQMLEAWANQTP
jgi:hypothetical protein